MGVYTQVHIPQRERGDMEKQEEEGMKETVNEKEVEEEEEGRKKRTGGRRENMFIKWLVKVYLKYIYSQWTKIENFMHFQQLRSGCKQTGIYYKT